MGITTHKQVEDYLVEDPADLLEQEVGDAGQRRVSANKLGRFERFNYGQPLAAFQSNWMITTTTKTVTPGIGT